MTIISLISLLPDGKQFVFILLYKQCSNKNFSMCTLELILKYFPKSSDSITSIAKLSTKLISFLSSLSRADSVILQHSFRMYIAFVSNNVGHHTYLLFWLLWIVYFIISIFILCFKNIFIEWYMSLCIWSFLPKALQCFYFYS